MAERSEPLEKRRFSESWVRGQPLRFSSSARFLVLDAEAAVDEEYAKLRRRVVWDEQGVREKDEVIAEAFANGTEAHFGKIFPSCTIPLMSDANVEWVQWTIFAFITTISYII